MVKSKHALFTHSKGIIIIINLFITSLYQYCKCEREERRFRTAAAYPPLAEKTGKVVKSKIKTLRTGIISKTNSVSDDSDFTSEW